MSTNLIGNSVITKPERFVMPQICVGQSVVWSPSLGGMKAAATVSKVGDSAISVHVHCDGILNHLIKGGVRHVDDPWLQNHPQAEEQGCWDYNDRDKFINKFIASFGGSE